MTSLPRRWKRTSSTKTTTTMTSWASGARARAVTRGRCHVRPRLLALFPPPLHLCARTVLPPLSLRASQLQRVPPLTTRRRLRRFRGFSRPCRRASLRWSTTRCGLGVILSHFQSTASKVRVSIKALYAARTLNCRRILTCNGRAGLCGTKVTYADLRTLRDGEWLNDEVGRLASIIRSLSTHRRSSDRQRCAGRRQRDGAPPRRPRPRRRAARPLLQLLLLCQTLQRRGRVRLQRRAALDGRAPQD